MEENVVRAYNVKSKRWEKAVEEPYYPTLIEKIVHFFGFHIYPDYEGKVPHRTPQCLICYKPKQP